MTPALYALPPGVPFARGFVAGLGPRLGHPGPLDWARVRVLVNTGRALRAIRAAMIAAAPGAAILPRLGLLSDLAADPLADPDLAPAVDPTRRQLWLTRLVTAYLAAEPGRAPAAAAPDLAQALAGLIDELHAAGVAPGRLDALAPADLAQHWQETLRFADLVRSAWPAILAEAEGGALDPAARQAQVIARLVAEWQTDPPGPVIAAGSTGSVGSTAVLLAAIARLPGGAVVLPGFDPGIDPAVWAALGPEHPMAPFTRLLGLLEMEPAQVRLWHGAVPDSPRLRLLSQALRPAPVTDDWVRAAPALAAETAAATQGLSLLEAETPRHEAAAIALAIRQGLEDPAARIALITPDASLARRVTVELGRWDIIPDDSLGQPLLQSAAGVFLRLVAEVGGERGDAVRLAALLSHPLCCPGGTRGDHLRAARAYERQVLRAGPVRGLAPWPDAEPVQLAWWQRIDAALAPLIAARAAPLSALVPAHLAVAEALSTPEGGEPGVWSGRDGARCRAALARIARAAEALGPDPVPDYPALLLSLTRAETLRPEPARPHPRVMIWGPREARVEAADLVILGGLNEGTWPAAPGADPWLSRPMRAALGLAAPEAAVGLAAHDFLLAATQPRALLTRSVKLDGAPQVASRWLIRLTNLLGGVDPAALAAMRARGDAWAALVPLVHRPVGATPRAPRPAPCPPRAARPRKLSVTQIERLIRDAYGVYAQKVLGLRVLDPLGRAPDYRDRGEVLHAILHRFVAATADGLPGDARAVLLATADAVLAEQVPWPDLRRIWRGRVHRFADWFLAGEQLRRATGRPLALEAKGALVLEAPGGDFTLTAKVDRIDSLGEGAAILDYKTGTPPSRKQVGVFSLQLHLQALILEQGGFEGLGPLHALSGAYLGLTGSGSEGGDETRVPDLAAELGDAWDRLGSLIADFDDPATPYLSWGRGEKVTDTGDYDHLARRAEWQGADE